MAKSPRNSISEAGITLVELLVVCVIIAIVAGIAMMQRGTANEQFKRQNVARELKTAFERARFDSVKRRAECNAQQAKVDVNGSSFVLTTYEEQASVMIAVPKTINFSSDNVVIADSAGATLSAPSTVYFNQRGEAVDIDGALISSTFLVCGPGACPNPLTSDRVNRIFLSPTGTVNMLGPGTPPTLGNPGGSAPATDAINNNLVLSTATGC